MFRNLPSVWNKFMMRPVQMFQAMRYVSVGRDDETIDLENAAKMSWKDTLTSGGGVIRWSPSFHHLGLGHYTYVYMINYTRPIRWSVETKPSSF